MANFFRTDGGIYLFMTRVYQLLVLNFLFLLSCLPIFTIGASMSAAFGTSYKLMKHEEEKLSDTYFKQFKRNFKQSTISWLGIMGLGVLFYFSYPFLKGFFEIFPFVFFLFALFLGVFFLSVIYLFPMIAKFQSPLPSLFLNSLTLALKHLPFSLLLFFLQGFVLIILPIYFPKIWFVWLFIGFGLVIYVSAIILNKIFSLYGQNE